MTTWFTSDEHHGHENLCKETFGGREGYSRPFSDATEMTETIIGRHNLVVKKDDTVWHLGDFAWDDRMIVAYLPRMNGHHILVPGNHDRCHPCHKRHIRETNRYLRWGFASIFPWRTTIDVPELDGEVLLTHMPKVEMRDPRYPEYRPNDWDGWIFHGHVHGAWKRRDKQINVGVDQWNFTPVSLEQLIEEALKS